ncbi:MAG: serine/threonine protein kinase [Phycisphaerae bacterium]|nr:serine/threonine protein kinase [Phycisphaerae bacterium]
MDSDDRGSTANRPTDHDRFVFRIVRQVLEAPDERQASMIAEVSDGAVRAEVRALVLLDAPVEDEFTDSSLDRLRRVAESPLPTIAGYRIVRALGEGGMGVVYEAEQERPKRTVALKVIRAAFASNSMRARFEMESELLGRLQHPGIAGILEAGSFDSPLGPQPFLTMELVRGEPLMTFAQSNRLPIADRIDLFSNVCDAVQHAHSRGVIHRDIKPANILVELSDQHATSGRPRVLDFGVARLVGELDAETPVRTATGELVGTPEYMSPEQFMLRPAELDIRTDVYSLGVTLYELLAGTPPFDLDGLPVAQIPERIGTSSPRPLSSIHPVCKGDIETVVAKAIAPERERRYSTASELAAELRRILAGDPVLARPESRSERFVRWVRRRPRIAGAAAGIAVTCALGGVVATWLAIETSMARDVAREESAISQAITEFLRNDVFASATPAVALGREITVREALDAASRRVEGRFADLPRAEAGVRSALGAAYIDIGRFEEAIRHLTVEVELRTRVEGADALPTLIAAGKLAYAIERSGNVGDAVARKEDILRRSARSLGTEADFTLSAMNGLGNTYLSAGRFQEAEALLAETVAERRRISGDTHPDTLVALNNLAIAHLRLGRREEAEAVFRSVLERSITAYGPKDPRVLTTRSNLGDLLFRSERLEEASSLLSEVLKDMREIEGSDSPRLLSTINSLGMVELDRGNVENARKLYEEAVELATRSLPKDSADATFSLSNLAGWHRKHGDVLQAVTLYEDVVDRASRVYAPSDPRHIHFLASLGFALLASPRFAEADQPFRRAWELLEKAGEDRFRLRPKIRAAMREWCERADHPDDANQWADPAPTG